MATAIKYKTLSNNIVLLKKYKQLLSMESTKERRYSDVMKNNAPP